MKQINVSVEDSVYDKAKAAGKKSGMLFRRWIETVVEDAADRYLADPRKLMIPHAGIQDGHSIPASPPITTSGSFAAAKATTVRPRPAAQTLSRADFQRQQREKEAVERESSRGL